MENALWILGLACLIAVATAQSTLPKVQPTAVAPPPVTDTCLGCICHAISSCKREVGCSGDTCGLFRITWAYWADSGKPTLNGEAPEAEGAWTRCVTDPYCAALAVQGYMRKFGQDCNHDGVIDCLDHAAIHKQGGYACHNPLTGEYGNKFNECYAKFGGS